MSTNIVLFCLVATTMAVVIRGNPWRAYYYDESRYDPEELSNSPDDEPGCKYPGKNCNDGYSYGCRYHKGERVIKENLFLNLYGSI